MERRDEPLHAAKRQWPGVRTLQRDVRFDLLRREVKRRLRRVELRSRGETHAAVGDFQRRVEERITVRVGPAEALREPRPVVTVLHAELAARRKMHHGEWRRDY